MQRHLPQATERRADQIPFARFPGYADACFQQRRGLLIGFLVAENLAF
jgi:hypothetical protein